MNQISAKRKERLIGVLFGLLGWVIAIVLNIMASAIADWPILSLLCIPVGHAVAIFCCAQLTSGGETKWVVPYVVSACMTLVIAVAATLAHVLPHIVDNMARLR